MSGPIFDTPELQTLYDAHPDFDLLRCDFTGRRPLNERLASVDAATLGQLKTGQRLLRLTRDDATAKTLYACGYGSAWQMASKSEAMFLRSLEGRLPTDTARQLYRRARGVKARTLHLWATVHNLLGSPHFRESRAGNLPVEMARYLSEIPDYEDLFGSLDYYEVAHCQSILGPAAYFVELLWYVDQYLDGPNAETIPVGFRLDERRPDLKQIELTCANSLDTVPFLKIINGVLRAHASGIDLTSGTYPWTLPLELPWEQALGDLAYLQADLFKIYRAFNDAVDSHGDLIGRAETGLSLDRAALVTTPVTDDPGLQVLYGLDVTEPPSTILQDRDLFLEHTGLTRSELATLLQQDLTQTEWDAGLGHRLYINQVLDGDEAVALEPVDESTDETLSPLTNEVLDRLHRFVRLCGALGWTFAELDTALRALGVAAPSDIEAVTLNTLGRLNSLRQQYELPVDTLCALFADMNTLGVGDPNQPVALFDRIYNLPDRIGKEAVYHPEYSDNVLYLDPPVIWNEDGSTSDESRFSSARLASCLGLSQGDLNALREAFWPDQTPGLDVPNLTELYRNTLLMQQLDYVLADYNLLLCLLGIVPTAETLTVPLQLGGDPLAGLARFETLPDTAAWLAQHGWTVRHPDYVLYGREYADVDALIPSASVPERMASFWAQVPPPEGVKKGMIPELIAQLHEGLALFFGIDTALFPGLARWAAGLTGMEDYLRVLYTPGDPENPEIATFLTHVSRYHLLATDAGLSGQQFDSMAAYPDRYGLPALPGAPENPAQPDFFQLRALVDFRDLVARCGDSEQEQLVAYLEYVANNDPDLEIKVEALSRITDWSASELQALVSADPSIGYGEADLDTAAGLLRLDDAFALLRTTGTNVALIKQLIALGSAPATDTSNQAVANGVRHLVESKYQGEQLTDVLRQLDDPLDERERNALAPWLMWTLNNQWAADPQTDYRLDSMQDLSEYLLLDVEMEGASDSTPVKQAQLSLQMYIQRCQIGLETGVTPVAVDNQQWAWLLDYRQWEANRKIFLYPENYLQPELRTDCSSGFAQLTNALQQGQLNDALVEQAFRDYLNEFEILARLEVVETARYSLEGTGSSADTLFVFGLAATQPPTFYYRRCTDPGLPQPVWHYWEKIDLQINAPTAVPAYAFGRLFLFWAEHKEINNSQDADDDPEIQITVRYSFLDAQNQWVAPQTLVADYVPVDVGYATIKTNPFWMRPYALVAPLDDPDDEAGEQILVSLGEVLDGDGLLNGNGSTAPNPHTWRLTAELFPRQIGSVFAIGIPWHHAASDSDHPPFSQPRDYLAAASAATADGGRATIFAGGTVGGSDHSDVVDIYAYKEGQLEHLSTDNPDVPPLSQARSSLAAASASTPNGGQAAIFAGGLKDSSASSDVVDIYEYENGAWTCLSSTDLALDIAPLSQARQNLAAASISTPDGGRAAIFAGGSEALESNAVDIYEYKDGAWTHFSSGNGDIPPLSQARFDLTATSVATPDGGLAAIFAGGVASGSFSNVVDIYEYKDGAWTRFSLFDQSDLALSPARSRLAAASVPTLNGGQAAIFAGGVEEGGVYSDVVDIYEYTGGQWTHLSSLDQGDLTLSQARGHAAAASVSTPAGGQAALFAGGLGEEVESFDAVDIYEYKDSAWTHLSSLDQGIPALAQARADLAAASASTPDGNLSAVFAGGYGESFSDTVDLFYAYSPVASPFLTDDSLQLKAAPAENRLADNYCNALTRGSEGEPENAVALLDTLPAGVTNKSVKNQAGWSVLHYGRRAFLGQPLPGAADTSDTIKEIANIMGTDPVAVSSGSHTGGWDAERPFLFTRLTTNVVQRFMQRLFSGGLDHLINLDSQRIPEFDLNRFGPTDQARVPEAGHLDFSGAYGPYYWEIFFHAPTLVAAALNAQQQFPQAKRWYEYVFAPTSQDETGLNEGNEDQRVWQFLPFRNYTLQTLDEILANERQLQVSMAQPFDPHAIAQLRIGAYEKMTVMAYIDTLLDWGDYYFAQDSWEAINRATTLYFLASDILGPQPRRLGYAPLPEDYPKTYADLEAELNTPTAAVEHLEQMVSAPTGEPALTEAGDAFPLENLTGYFGVNENQDFVGYWDRVEDRLYKIRNGMNIDGVARELALFQPPVDPNQLVQATAAGGSGAISISSTGTVPYYRFDVVLARARNVTANLIQLGSSLLATLERQDAEALAQLQSSQQSQLLQLVTQTKQQQIEEAEANREALQRGLEAAQYRQQYYEGLVADGLSPEESSNLHLLGLAQAPLLAASTIYGLAIAGYLLPDTFGLSDGGMDFGKGIEMGAGISNSIAANINQEASIMSVTAEYNRRNDDWAAQAGIAQRDAAQIEQQIAAMDVAVEIAQSELESHQTSVEQASEIETFYLSKYTNQELYQWMSGQLSTAYYQCYQIALSLGSQAEQAYQYELNRTDTYLRTDYWDSARQGLTAGEQLMWGLDQLEKAYLDNHVRMLEVERSVSLQQYAPEALAALKQNGLCTFSLPERLFDQDYPGHYCRQIKTLSVSIPALIGPYQNIKATLTQTSNKVLMQPDIDGVKYLLGSKGGEPDASVLRQDWRPNQQIALSSGLDDSGQFMLNFQDERYLPFEGTGAVSDWTLEMPKAANPIDFNSITDVIFHVRYMALYDSTLRNQVVALPEVQHYDGILYLGLRQFASASWAAFAQDEALPADIAFTLTEALLPPNVSAPQLSSATIRALFVDGQNGTPTWTLNDGAPIEGDGAFAEAPLLDANTLSLTAGDVMPDQIQDIVLIVPFTGTLAW